jgi:hypothetical protein
VRRVDGLEAAIIGTGNCGVGGLNVVDVDSVWARSSP